MIYVASLLAACLALRASRLFLHRCREIGHDVTLCTFYFLFYVFQSDCLAVPCGLTGERCDILPC